MILLQEETVCFKIAEEAKVNIISTEKQEKSGWNFQEILNQPQEIPGQD